MPRAKKPRPAKQTSPDRRLSIYRRDYMEMIDLLRLVRLEAGLKQVDVAERLGVQQTFVSKIEIRDRRLDLIELRDLCAVYGITPQQFLERLESRLLELDSE